MAIRKATLDDANAIKQLLKQLDYPPGSFVRKKMSAVMDNPNAYLLVHEEAGTVNGFLQLDFVAQVALRGDFARISYFAVDQQARSKGIGLALEQYVVKLAKKRKCDRIEVHCHERRKAAHRFYYRQGYKEAPKYLVKPVG